jgi:glycosyltransferase involved in cell wall biosynthesis
MTAINKTPSFAFIIPCLNEEAYLQQAVEAIVKNGYPLNKLEVMIVDGGSKDRTIEIALSLAQQYEAVCVFDNPKKILAAAWNIGIENSNSDFIIAGNAHAKIEKDHFAKLAQLSIEHSADCYAPMLVTHPQDDTIFGKTVGDMMCHKFGVGNSEFRTTKGGEPRYVDTAHLGAYRNQVFLEGFRYNEEMVRSQDVELHKRLRLNGKKLLLCPSIKVHYYTRSNPKGFFKFGFINGYWVTKPMQFGTTIASARHLIPMIFVSSIIFPLLFSLFIPNIYVVSIAAISMYLLLLLSVAIKQSIHARKLFYLVLSPIVFSSYHISYGLGSLAGLITSFKSMRFWTMVKKSIFS